MASVAKELELALIHEILPTEIFVMILKKMGFKSLGNAKLTCREWRNVIHSFGLREAAIGKFESNQLELLLSFSNRSFQRKFHL